MTKPLSDICPWEADFPTKTIPCEYRRGHDGPHSYFTHPGQLDGLCDECGLVSCICEHEERTP